MIFFEDLKEIDLLECLEMKILLTYLCYLLLF